MSDPGGNIDPDEYEKLNREVETKEAENDLLTAIIRMRDLHEKAENARVAGTIKKAIRAAEEAVVELEEYQRLADDG